VAARLVTMELVHAMAAMESAAKGTPRPSEEVAELVGLPQWKAHRAVLARTLARKDWWTVNAAAWAAQRGLTQPSENLRASCEAGVDALKKPAGLEAESIRRIQSVEVGLMGISAKVTARPSAPPAGEEPPRPPD
jgi:hypothetical protein